VGREGPARTALVAVDDEAAGRVEVREQQRSGAALEGAVAGRDGVGVAVHRQQQRPGLRDVVRARGRVPDQAEGDLGRLVVVAGTAPEQVPGGVGGTHPHILGSRRRRVAARR
jgi:hypothetical protein